MKAQPESDEALVKRLLPSVTARAEDRAHAWAEWYTRIGSQAVLKFIRVKNDTAEPDEDILQDAIVTAYQEVERGRYEHRAGIPFTAYVKGIAHNRIREARRKQRGWQTLDDITQLPAEPTYRPIEWMLEDDERQQALRCGLARLPLRRRQVLERYLSGERMSEIAAHLVMTEEQVRQHKHRGVRSLQQMSLFISTQG
jgi:RNA polymerase sigma factor (sigma-70 family)